MLIQRAAAAGTVPRVVTVFTEGDNYGMRRQEDLDACALLGAEAIHLGFADAPFRNPRYNNVTELIFGEPDVDDLACAWEIADRLRELVGDEEGSGIYFPLGSGNHIDHRLVYIASAALRGREDCLFYEDRPYSLWPGNLTARLSNLGFAAKLPHVSPAEMAASIDGYSFTASFVACGGVRNTLLPRYLQALERGALVEAKGVAEVEKELRGTEPEIQTAWLALRCFGSQIDGIYPHKAGFTNDNSKHSELYSGKPGYLERYWKLRPA